MQIAAIRQGTQALRPSRRKAEMKAFGTFGDDPCDGLGIEVRIEGPAWSQVRSLVGLYQGTMKASLSGFVLPKPESEFLTAGAGNG
jgi:hypothetical protein